MVRGPVTALSCRLSTLHRVSVEYRGAPISSHLRRLPGRIRTALLPRVLFGFTFPCCRRHVKRAFLPPGRAAHAWLPEDWNHAEMLMPTACASAACIAPMSHICRMAGCDAIVAHALVAECQLVLEPGISMENFTAERKVSLRGAVEDMASTICLATKWEVRD